MSRTFENITRKLTKTIKYDEINKISSKSRRLLSKIVYAPIILWQLLSDDRRIQSIEKSGKFKYELSFAVIVKNEVPYIKEWIEYHRYIGVTHFYVYDNESTDGLKDVLKSYIDEGVVDYTYYPGKLRQLEAYKDAAIKHKFDSHYIGFFDVDEFLLMNINGVSLPSLTTRVFNSYDGVGAYAINWRHFGSSGHIEKPDGLVIENYTHRAEDDFDRNLLVKTICNPRRVVHFLNPHHPVLDDGYRIVNENGVTVTDQFCADNSCSLMQVNHYFCKSREEARKKMERGKISDSKKLDWSVFESRDRNEVLDEGMLPYVTPCKEALERRV